LALGLSACTGLMPGSGPAPDLYTLSPKSSFDTALPDVSWQLVVEVPFASGGLATQSIALRSNALELRYFAGARWIERAPRLVQTLLVESFENTGRIVAVGRAADLRSDFNLKSELREFQAEYESESAPPLIRVRLNAKIVQQPQREIIASANFEATARAAGTNMAGIITAFDEAFGKVLRRVVEWTLITADSRS
jgi:cholesterol transport system auxiliary component